jgi:hypothetical protein
MNQRQQEEQQTLKYKNNNILRIVIALSIAVNTTKHKIMPFK